MVFQMNIDLSLMLYDIHDKNLNFSLKHGLANSKRERFWGASGILKWIH